MSVDFKGPYTLDLSQLQDRLKDLDPDEKRGLRVELERLPEVVAELAHAMPLHGAAAGIPQDVYNHFLYSNETVEIIDEKLSIAEKQVEVLKESRAYYVDARENDLSIMVDSMRSRAQRRKDESILTPFEKTLTYRAQIGVKAARTRRKNAEQAVEVEVEAEGIRTSVEAELAAYKAELEASFQDAVNAAVEKRLAQMSAAVAAPPASQPMPS